MLHVYLAKIKNVKYNSELEKEISPKTGIQKDSYRERWRDWPDEARQPVESGANTSSPAGWMMRGRVVWFMSALPLWESAFFI